MTEAEEAWVAGLLEGEGCFTVAVRKYKDKVYHYPRIICLSTDFDVLEKLQKITGLGNINDGYEVPDKEYKPTRQWIVSKGVDAMGLMMTLYPYMSVRRRRQIEEVAIIWDRHLTTYGRRNLE